MPKRKPERGDDDDEEADVGVVESSKITVVKLCLPSVVTDERIRAKMEADVLEMSRLAHEASLYIYWDVCSKLEDDGECVPLRKGNNVFLPYFYDLLHGSKAKYNLREDYAAIRPRNLAKYDKTYRSNLFVSLARHYQTAFENNLWMHAYSRVKRFVKRVYEISCPDMLRRVMNHLFLSNNDDDGTAAAAGWLTADDPVPVWGRGHFAGLKNDPYARLREFHTIWTYNRENRIRNFKLIPTHRFGRSHVTYDRSAFHQLLSSVGLAPRKLNDRGRSVQCNYNEINILDYITLPRKNMRFYGSFTTDGVSCCVRFHCRRKETETPHQQQQQRHRSLESETYIGIDPGMRLFVAGVAATGSTHENIKYSSKRHHHETGMTRRRDARKRYTDNVDERIEELRPPEQTWREYVVFELRHMDEKQTACMQKRVARLRFDAYTCKQRAMSKLVNDHFVKRRNSVTVFFGSSTQAANSPMRGYVRNPHKQLIDALERHPKVKMKFVDEYNSTKVCSGFWTRDAHVVSRSPHRFSSCSRCKIVWNRDINAGNNILVLGLYNYIYNIHWSLRHIC